MTWKQLQILRYMRRNGLLRLKYTNVFETKLNAQPVWQLYFSYLYHHKTE